jgi:hypothetical protein
VQSLELGMDYVHAQCITHSTGSHQVQHVIAHLHQGNLKHAVVTNTLASTHCECQFSRGADHVPDKCSKTAFNIGWQPALGGPHTIRKDSKQDCCLGQFSAFWTTLQPLTLISYDMI